MSNTKSQMQDVTSATGRQVMDDIFEESRLLRTELDSDIDADSLLGMDLPSDPFIGFYAGGIQVDGERHDDGETLVVASASQQRRYLIKRWNRRSSFKAYQHTPVESETLRLLNVYRVMTGQPVS